MGRISVWPPIYKDKSQVPSFRASQVAQLAKNLPSNAGGIGDAGLIPGLGRSLEEEVSTTQYSCLENPMDRGAWRVHGVAKSWTQLIMRMPIL